MNFTESFSRTPQPPENDLQRHNDFDELFVDTDMAIVKCDTGKSGLTDSRITERVEASASIEADEEDVDDDTEYTFDTVEDAMRWLFDDD